MQVKSKAKGKKEQEVKNCQNCSSKEENKENLFEVVTSSVADAIGIVLCAVLFFATLEFFHVNLHQVYFLPGTESFLAQFTGLKLIVSLAILCVLLLIARKTQPLNTAVLLILILVIITGVVDIYHYIFYDKTKTQLFSYLNSTFGGIQAILAFVVLVIIFGPKSSGDGAGKQEDQGSTQTKSTGPDQKTQYASSQKGGGPEDSSDATSDASGGDGD